MFSFLSRDRVWISNAAEEPSTQKHEFQKYPGQPSKDPQAQKMYTGKPTSSAPATLSACSTVLPVVLPRTEDDQFVIGKSLEGERFIILSSRFHVKLLKTLD